MSNLEGMNSILTSIKKQLGIAEDYTHFDMDIIIHINSVLMVLNQMGVGPENAFTISDSSTLWTDFIPADNKNFEAVKTYIFLKVKLVFDPPLSSSVLEAMKQMVSELEWRLNFSAELIKSSNQEV